MAKYTSNRQRKLKIGITSYTENLTVLEVTGGAYISSSVGIGTTNQSQSLHVQGNARITGAVYDSTNLPGSPGQVLQSTVTGTQWVNTSNVGGITTYANTAGIATYATSSGIATYSTSSGIATYATSSGIATYSTSSGIATYATNAGIATYATNSGIATYSTSSGIATYATNSGIATDVIGGIASVTSLSVSTTGISTLGIVQISSGIITATVGVVTYYGDGSNLTNIKASAIIGGIGYVDYAGIATNVIGGIASVTSLSVSTTGISTLGIVQISSGIITATAAGVVTYYGDGSKLTGISSIGSQLTIADKTGVSSPIYPTLATNIGTSDVGISTNKLSFIPSTNKLGIGTGAPRENLDVVGTIGIQSAGFPNRFYLQYNPSQSSIDFIFV